jgi:hypothetical protein
MAVRAMQKNKICNVLFYSIFYLNNKYKTTLLESLNLKGWEAFKQVRESGNPIE